MDLGSWISGTDGAASEGRAVGNKVSTENSEASNIGSTLTISSKTAGTETPTAASLSF